MGRDDAVNEMWARRLDAEREQYDHDLATLRAENERLKHLTDNLGAADAQLRDINYHLNARCERYRKALEEISKTDDGEARCRCVTVSRKALEDPVDPEPLP